MDNSRMNGAKAGVQTMMYYFLLAAMEQEEDPKQYIATELGKMIDLSEEQIQYVQLSINNESKLMDNLKLCIQLLEPMKDTNTVDLESIKIVKEILVLIKDQCKDTLNKLHYDINPVIDESNE